MKVFSIGVSSEGTETITNCCAWDDLA